LLDDRLRSPFIPQSPAVEQMLMMAPLPRAVMPGRDGLMPKPPPIQVDGKHAFDIGLLKVDDRGRMHDAALLISYVGPLLQPARCRSRHDSQSSSRFTSSLAEIQPTGLPDLLRDVALPSVLEHGPGDDHLGPPTATAKRVRAVGGARLVRDPAAHLRKWMQPQSTRCKSCFPIAFHQLEYALVVES
jgi:hypothetical protein